MKTDKIILFLRKTYFLLLLILILPAIVYALFIFQTRHSDEMILRGQHPVQMHFWKSIPLFSGPASERIGTAELLLRGKDSAEPYFRNKKTKPIPVWRDVLKKLWESGRYEDGLFYAGHLRKQIRNENILSFYDAGFLAGKNQLQEAQKEILAAGSMPELATESALLRSEIEHRISTGQYTLAFDRKNLPLVSKSLQGTLKILYDPLQTVFHNSSGDYLVRLKDQATLTVDYRIQMAALKALGKYAGAIILLDVHKGDILAAASNSRSPGTAVATDAMYEPGSIIKMITLAGALESRSNPEKLFPLQCDGVMKLSDNQAFYCWKIHGQVTDVNVATAISCNVAFAEIGLAMKPEDLLTNLRKFGFDARLRGDYLPLQLGKIMNGSVNDRYVANLSIGLEALKITPVHAAMVAAAIANEGVCMAPRLLLNYRNVIGLSYSARQPSVFRRFMSKQTAHALTRAMEQVILHPEGTGRRAAVPGLSIAMKTGTAGKGATGYDAILIGFAPVKNPKVAFAVVAEHSGKAEFEGARITKLFLESIQGYIQ